MADQQIAPIQLVQGVLTLSAPLWPTLASFMLGEQQTLTQLQQWLATATPTVAYLTGERSAGKTHLAQALLAQQSQLGARCAFISANDSAGLTPERLQGLEQLTLVCIDDADKLLAQPIWLAAVQQLAVLMRDTGGCLLLVQRSTTPYPALVGLPCPLLPLTHDNDKRQLLMARAQQRDVVLTKTVVNWLMKHFSEDVGQLMHVLAYLDHGSRTLKHRITLPFAKKLLLQA